MTTLTLHLPLVVDDDPRVVLEVDVHAVLPPPRLALADHHSGHHCDTPGETHRERSTATLDKVLTTWLAALIIRRAHGGYSPFFLSSGLPFFTEAITMSPTAAHQARVVISV